MYQQPPTTPRGMNSWNMATTKKVRFFLQKQASLVPRNNNMEQEQWRQ